jgi:uncharacterized membrane protein
VSVRDENGGSAGASEPNGASLSDQSRPPSEDGAKRPFGVVVASAVVGFRTLLRQHAELAKLEATEAASIRARGGGMMAAAAVLALFVVGFAGVAGAAALDLVMPTWAANLIIAVVFAVAAGALVLVGRRAMRSAPTGTDRTRETLKEDARWARQQIAR